MSYESAQKKYLAAYKKTEEAKQKQAEAYIKLKEERANAKFQCICGFVTKLKDVEMIRESTWHRSYSSYEDGRYTYSEYFVCHKCSECFKIPDMPEMKQLPGETFAPRFEDYVKVVLKWDGQNTACRAYELIKPSLERKKTKEAEQEKQRKIKEARKFLIEAGELKEQNNP